MDRSRIVNCFSLSYRTIFSLLVTMMYAGLVARAQAVPNTLSFEVASIRQVLIDSSHPFNPYHFWAEVTPAGASYKSMTPASLISYAYSIEPSEIKGPEWISDVYYDVQARFPEGAEKKSDRRMLQNLLKDRFKLDFHIEKEELETYVLVVGKLGPKLKPSSPDPVPVATEVPPDSPAHSEGIGNGGSGIVRNQNGSSTVKMGKRGTQTVKVDREKWAIHFERSKITMEDLASRLSTCLGNGFHTVVDMTGIKGEYQLAYDCPMPGPRPPTGKDANSVLPSDPPDSSVLTHSLESLGLKIEKRKVKNDVYVIERIEKPSEN